MELGISIFIIVLVLGFVLLLSLRRIVIYEHERGLQYRNGIFLRVLEPGPHVYFGPGNYVRKMDVRPRFVTISGQEVLSSDNVGIRVSLAVQYQVQDPHKAVSNALDYEAAVYLLLQVQLRDLVGAVSMDELLSKRKEIGQALLDGLRDRAAGLGLVVELASIKDIMFPGELKNIYAQVVNARNEGLAALERARGESAALRNLANSAKLLETNPGLLQLRIIQAVEAKTGNTIVLSTSPEARNLFTLPNKA
jgi:regulator of protease activity HflC (stomatin/prohibitin superfamily)